MTDKPCKCRMQTKAAWWGRSSQQTFNTILISPPGVPTRVRRQGRLSFHWQILRWRLLKEKRQREEYLFNGTGKRKKNFLITTIYFRSKIEQMKWGRALLSLFHFICKVIQNCLSVRSVASMDSKPIFKVVLLIFFTGNIATFRVEWPGGRTQIPELGFDFSIFSTPLSSFCCWYSTSSLAWTVGCSTKRVLWAWGAGEPQEEISFPSLNVHLCQKKRN